LEFFFTSLQTAKTKKASVLPDAPAEGVGVVEEEGIWTGEVGGLLPRGVSV
jgi:hypothetical protein